MDEGISQEGNDKTSLASLEKKYLISLIRTKIVINLLSAHGPSATVSKKSVNFHASQAYAILNETDPVKLDRLTQALDQSDINFNILEFDDSDDSDIDQFISASDVTN